MHLAFGFVDSRPLSPRKTNENLNNNLMERSTFHVQIYDQNHITNVTVKMKIFYFCHKYLVQTAKSKKNSTMLKYSKIKRLIYVYKIDKTCS